MPFYKYRTDLGNTVTAKSSTSFTGLTGNEAQISSTIDTPAIQSVNLYKVVGGVLTDNDDTTINNYYKSIGVVTQGVPTYNQFTGYTGTTAPATYLKISNFNTYSASTLTNIQSRLLTSAFNTYSGNTANLINTKIGSANNGLRKSGTNIYLGGSLTGSTNLGLGTFNLILTGTSGTLRYGSDLSAQYNVRSLIDKGFVTGITTTLVTQSKINTYTGTTEPLLYQSKSSIVTLTGTTLPLTYQSKSSIVTLTGTTLPLTYQSKNSIVTLTGTTLPNTYVAKSVFSTYTGGTTNVTSANNGIRKNGNNVRIGGSLTGSTNLGLGTFNLILTGTTGTLRYGSDLSAQYNIRSLVDKGFVTGITSTLLPKSGGTITGALGVNGSGSYGGSLAVTGSITEGGVALISKYLTLSGLTANNGITRAGNSTNLHLGGSLTGATTITSPATGSRLSFAGFPVQYSTDVSANYNPRSHVDYGWVTANTQSILIFKNNATQLNTPPAEFTTVNFSSGHTLINRGSGVIEVKVLYGSEVFSTGKTTTQTSTSATFADYCAKGFTLAGGTYKVEYCMKVGNNTTLGTNIGIQLLVDGTAIESGTVNAYRISTSNTFVFVSGFKVLTLAAGSHSFRAQFATAANTATADYCQILITRIS